MKGAATSPPVKTMPHGSSRRPTALPCARGTQSLPELTAAQIDSIHRFEDQRADQENEYPNHDEAVRRYKQQNGYR